MHIGTHVTRASIGTRIMHWIHPISIDWYRKIAYMNPSNICIHQYQNFLVHKIRGAVPYRAFTLTTAGDFSRPVLLNQLFRPSNSKPAPQLSKCSFWRWIYAYQAFPPRTWVKGGAGQECARKVAGARCYRDLSYIDVCGAFQDACGLERKMIKHVLLGSIFWRAWGSKPRSFDCIFIRFYRFQQTGHSFDMKHAKVWLDCEKTMENAIGELFASSCLLHKQVGFTSQFVWFCVFFIKSLFCFEANLQQDKLQYVCQKKAQTCHRSMQFCGLRLKSNLVAKPFKFRRGGEPSPKRTRNCSNIVFTVLSCLA